MNDEKKRRSLSAREKVQVVDWMRQNPDRTRRMSNSELAPVISTALNIPAMTPANVSTQRTGVGIHYEPERAGPKRQKRETNVVSDAHVLGRMLRLCMEAIAQLSAELGYSNPTIGKINDLLTKADQRERKVEEPPQIPFALPIPHAQDIARVMSKAPSTMFSVRDVTKILHDVPQQQVGDSLRSMVKVGAIEVAKVVQNANLYRWKRGDAGTLRA